MEENKMELVENVCEEVNVEEATKRGGGVLKTIGLIGAGLLACKILITGVKKIQERRARNKAEEVKTVENASDANDDDDFDIEQPIDSEE